MKCAADVSFNNRWKTHVFHIPKKWQTVSQLVRKWNWGKHKLVVFSNILIIFLTIVISLLSFCRSQSYGGEVKSKVYTIKIDISVSFTFTKIDLLPSEKCSAIKVSASSWFDVKRLCYWDCEIYTVSFLILSCITH